jgi:hypothetical protein
MASPKTFVYLFIYLLLVFITRVLGSSRLDIRNIYRVKCPSSRIGYSLDFRLLVYIVLKNCLQLRKSSLGRGVSRGSTKAKLLTTQAKP